MALQGPVAHASPYVTMSTTAGYKNNLHFDQGDHTFSLLTWALTANLSDSKKAVRQCCNSVWPEADRASSMQKDGGLTDAAWSTAPEQVDMLIALMNDSKCQGSPNQPTQQPIAVVQAPHADRGGWFVMPGLGIAISVVSQQSPAVLLDTRLEAHGSLGLDAATEAAGNTVIGLAGFMTRLTVITARGIAAKGMQGVKEIEVSYTNEHCLLTHSCYILAVLLPNTECFITGYCMHVLLYVGRTADHASERARLQEARHYSRPWNTGGK